MSSMFLTGKNVVSIRGTLDFVILEPSDAHLLMDIDGYLFINTNDGMYLIQSFAWDQDMSFLHAYRNTHAVRDTLYPPQAAVVRRAMRRVAVCLD